MFWIKNISDLVPGFFATIFRHPVAYTRARIEAARRFKELAAETKLPYEIPVYRPDMPCCKSRQKYLRPTFLCQSRAPEIIALANELGAFRKPDREYAEACFDFVKRNIQFTVFQSPAGAVKTLKTGKGICSDKASLFIALCRTAGIPARYQFYDLAFITSAYEKLVHNNPVTREWYDSLGYLALHTAAEVFIDGEWIPGECVQTPELEAGIGAPLLQLGEDSSGSWHYRVPGSAYSREWLPPGLIISLSVLIVLERGFFFPIEMQIRDTAKRGSIVLARLGEEEYNRRAKETHRATLPEVSRRLFMALRKAEEEDEERRS